MEYEMKVSFLGLGVMGYPMAGYLVKAGHEVCVYNRTLDKAAKWVQQHGGTHADTPSDAAKGAEIVFTCVGNDDDLRQVVNGEQGAFRSMNRGTLLVDHTTTSANVGIDLFNGLHNIQQLYRANLSILASQYQLADMKENISLLVANSYLQILFNRESLGVQQSQLNVANEELIIAQERLKTGIIPQGDVLQIEANVATIEQNVVVAENSYQLSKISLAQLLLISEIDNFEIAQETAIIPESTILNRNVNSIYLTAVSKRNDVKLAETNLKIAKKDLAISRSNSLPKLSGSYSYNSGVLFNGANDDSNILAFPIKAGQVFGLNLSVPIFNGMTNNTNIRRNKLNIQKSTYALEQVKLDLENTINQAYNDAKGSLKAYQAAEKTLKARKLAYEYAKERFDNGGMNTFNFLQAGQKYEAAQSELIKTKYNYIFKLKVLEFYFGEASL